MLEYQGSDRPLLPWFLSVRAGSGDANAIRLVLLGR